jgi:LacI family transcriptional regulator
VVTRTDVARHAGVSAAVVSYVLNDGPRPVAAGTRERVLAAIKELGYRPNGVARALKLRRTHTLGLVVPDNSNPYFAELAKAIEDVAFARGYSLLLGNSSDDATREFEQIRAFLDRQVDALMLISVRADPDLSVLKRSGTPAVLIDRASATVTVPTVSVDNAAGASAATRHLIEHGHRRIGCITGPGHLPAVRDRLTGYTRALDDHGIHRAHELVHSAPFTRTGGLAAARVLLTLTAPPTALFVASDLQAVGALRAAVELGLKVPRDLAVVSFDGTQESLYADPSLTAIRQPVEQIARRAIDQLLPGDDAGEPHTVLSAELVVRESCGCPPASVRPSSVRPGGGVG